MWSLIFFLAYSWWLVVTGIKYGEYKEKSMNKKFELELLWKAMAWPWRRIQSWIDKNIQY